MVRILLNSPEFGPYRAYSMGRQPQVGKVKFCISPIGKSVFVRIETFLS